MFDDESISTKVSDCFVEEERIENAHDKVEERKDVRITGKKIRTS